MKKHFLLFPFLCIGLWSIVKGKNDLGKNQNFDISKMQTLDEVNNQALGL
jgi:hypothetical protein